jgi:hypothetical protein
MNYLIHATLVHPSLCLQYLILLFTIVTTVVFILLLLLLFCYCYYYKIVATDKLLRASLLLGTAELTTYLSRLINILWQPLYQINKFGFYFPRRLLWSPILVGHHPAATVSRRENRSPPEWLPSRAEAKVKEICPRGNNNIIIIFLIHDNVYIPC